MISLSALCDGPPLERGWNEEGYVVLPGLLPDPLIEAYCDEWLRFCGEPQGWDDSTPYMRYAALQDLVCYAPLQAAIWELIGEPPAVHLCLTGWVSTERDWHPDAYLNPVSVGDHYAAAWMALADVSPDAGPLEVIPGSHKWPTVTMRRVLEALNVDASDHSWPRQSERLLTPIYEEEMRQRGVQPVPQILKRGDVLLWHPRLVHRGSPPRVPGSERRALIAHYSGIHSRPDMPPAVEQGKGGGRYFPLRGGPMR